MIIMAPLRQTLRNCAGKIALVVWRKAPMLFLQSSGHRHGIDPQCQRPYLLFSRGQGPQFDHQLVLSGFPVLIELIMKPFASLPAVLLIKHHLAVHFENESALVVVEYAVDKSFISRHVQSQLVMARMRGPEDLRGRRR